MGNGLRPEVRDFQNFESRLTPFSRVSHFTSESLLSPATYPLVDAKYSASLMAMAHGPGYSLITLSRWCRQLIKDRYSFEPTTGLDSADYRL